MNIMLKVAMLNEGGELDSSVVASTEAAAEALIEMVRAAGELHDGDRFTVTALEP